MGTLGEVVVGLVVLVGLVGVVVQVLPGLFLVAAAVIVWGIVTGGPVGWTVVGGRRAGHGRWRGSGSTCWPGGT